MDEEVTNQSPETTEASVPTSTNETGTKDTADTEAPEIDFGEDEQTSEESAETNEEATDTDQNKPTEEPDEDFLDITYNGEAKKLSKKDAITFAQKGMNYDKQTQKLNALQNDPVMKAFKAQADSVGLSLNDYAQRLSQFQEQSQIKQIADNFIAENPDVSEEVAKKYAEAEFKNQKITQASQQLQQSKEQAKSENDHLISEVKSFSQRYPSVEIEKLPVEVIDEINSGASLETAYLRYQNTQLNTRLKNDSLNKANKQKNVGSITSDVSGTGKDPFLEGLFGK
jgi:hypothetical protein